nr:immunoglobulin light chain junction region [Macaca mulatta]MOV92263.1 immunoglobulin light chain junction region [Macaca mulatta]MOV92355.1 immunoglobulin light chain junction region [Macaca mulatta]MOV92720.1 immunoglobulin light chain junction region [Macaca mulatta]MOV92843.1 immunoglobulin light chain junction region [Macaca mulatta]
CMQYTHMYSF